MAFYARSCHGSTSLKLIRSERISAIQPDKARHSEALVINEAMIVENLLAQAPFTTKDGSTIRSILDRSNSPVNFQSLAEATLPMGCGTQNHYHKLSEEIYFILE